MEGDRELRRAGWRLIVAQLRAQGRWLGYGVLAGLCWTVAKLVIPLLAAAAIDEGIIPDDGDAILRYTLLILVVGVVQAVGTGLRRYAAFRLAYRVETDLRERLFAHLQRLHFAFHDEAQTGQLMARANTDIQQINKIAHRSIPLTIASMLHDDRRVAIDPGAREPGARAARARRAAAPQHRWPTRFTHRMCPVGLALQQELGELSGVVEESVAGVRVVKGFGAERLQIERARRPRPTRVLDRALGAARLRAGFMPLHRLPARARARRASSGTAATRCSTATSRSATSSPFNLYVLMLIWPLRMVGHAARAGAARGGGGGPHPRGARHRSRDRRPARAPRRCPTGPGEVRFEGVHVRLRRRAGRCSTASTS